MVQSDDAVTEAGGCHLHGQMTQATAGAEHGDVAAGYAVGFAQGGVDGDTCAEERSCSGGVESLWDRRNIVGRPDHVLLESSWMVVSADLLVEADAVVTIEAGSYTKQV